MVRRVDKPIRLHVMTIFIVIAYGLLPIISAIPIGGGILLVGPRFLPFNGSVQALYDGNGEISTLLLIVTLGLGLSAVGSAVVTFFGVGETRWITLLLLTLNLGWWFFLVISAIMESDNSSQSLSWALQLLFPPLWLAFVWWNWT